MTRAELADRLARRVLLADGGMGTELYAKGFYLNTCFDELNLAGPDLVADVHRAYVKAGSDLVETNTFGANRVKLRKHGLEGKVREINRRGAAIARAAAGEGVLVAGSIGPLGVRTEPRGTLPVAEADAAVREQAEALVEGGVDLLILETFPDLDDLVRAVRAARAVAGDLPVIAQMTIGEDGASLAGLPPEDFARGIEEAGADVAGVNCSVGPAPMLGCVERMARATSLPLSAMPNAGMPRAVDGRNLYLSSPDYMAEFARRFIQAGVKIVGGCCGTTPAHIRAMRAAIRSMHPGRRESVAGAAAAAPRPEAAPGPSVPTAAKSGLGRRLAAGEFVVSVEVLPPRGHLAAGALQAAARMGEAGIPCVNIPDGPRATARMGAAALAVLIAREGRVEPILHFVCRDRNLLGMQSDLLGLFAQGVRNLLVITGDPPKIGDYPDATAVFDVDSIGLCDLVRSLNRGVDAGGRKLDAPTAFLVGVGANPCAPCRDSELRRFEKKVAAGAEFAVTQPVFDPRTLEGFLRDIEPFRIPVVAGLWPLVSLRNAEFMANEIPGVVVPGQVLERMRRAQDRAPEEARREGVAIARETLAAVRGMVQGVQVSPPLGRFDLALEVLK